MFRGEELRLTLARPSFVSAQYLWNFTIFACSKCMRLSNTPFTFSWKDNKEILKWRSWVYLSSLCFNFNLMEKIRHNYIFIGNIITAKQKSQHVTALFRESFCGASHLQLLEVLPLWNHDFIPDHLDPFLRVHGQVRIIYPRDITLIDLKWEIIL